MNLKHLLTVAVLALPFVHNAAAQSYDTNGAVVQTFAGSGFYGYLDGQGTQTMFNNPNAVVADSHSNLFVWDADNFRIRKITPGGTVTTFAGGGEQPTGAGTNVTFPSNPFYLARSMAIDREDSLWLVAVPRLYRVSSNAVVTFTNLPLNAFSRSRGICADSSLNIYLSDYDKNIIYRLSQNGALSVFAGSGNPGHADGNGVFTSFNGPEALAIDAADNIYVWDSMNGLLRRIDQNQNVTTFVGNLPGIVGSISFDGYGNVLLACGSCVAKVTPTTNLLIMAGSISQSGYTNGAGILARFNGAGGVCVSQGMIFVADAGNQRIRNIVFNPSEQPVSPANLLLNTYAGLQIIGTVGRTYRIETSPDITNWTARANVLLNSSPYLWLDHDPISGSKYYRAVLLP